MGNAGIKSKILRWLRAYGKLLFLLAAITVAVHFFITQILFRNLFFDFGTPDNDRWFSAEGEGSTFTFTLPCQK